MLASAGFFADRDADECVFGFADEELDFGGVASTSDAVSFLLRYGVSRSLGMFSASAGSGDSRTDFRSFFLGRPRFLLPDDSGVAVKDASL